MSLTSPLVFVFFALDYDKWSAIWITIAIYSVLYALGVLMFNWLNNGSAFRFSLGSKWELIAEGKRMTETIFNPLWGMGTIERQVIADVYRKKLRNGMYKYKTVPRN
jgi:hypothetical protein